MRYIYGAASLGWGAALQFPADLRGPKGAPFLPMILGGRRASLRIQNRVFIVVLVTRVVKILVVHFHLLLLIDEKPSVIQCSLWPYDVDKVLFNFFKIDLSVLVKLGFHELVGVRVAV